MDLSPFNAKVRDEWEDIGNHDILFLITCVVAAAAAPPTAAAHFSFPSPHSVQATPALMAAEAANSWEGLDQAELGIRTVRGCEVYQVLDESKKVVGEYDEHGNLNERVGNVRTYRVDLDSAQYQVPSASNARARRGMAR